MNDDLVAFLRARLHEDEQAALDCIPASELADLRQGQPPRRWRRDGPQITSGIVAQVGQASAWAAAHIIRHDPVRVLAEVDAKRRILDGLAGALDRHADYITGAFTAEDVLHLLALPYRHHPGYRPEWAPDA